MTRGLGLVLSTGAAAFALGAAQPPSGFAEVQPGLWEISGVPGVRAPLHQCIADVAVLARFEHRSNSCSAKLLRDAGSSTEIDYCYGSADFCPSSVDVSTPRSLRIRPNGLSGAVPFNYVVQAPRIDKYPKSARPTRH